MEEKFRIEAPSQDLLDELGALVDDIEERVHRGEDYEEHLQRLNSRLVTPMTKEDICTYYGACSRDEFIRGHLTPDPYAAKYRNLTDAEMLWLIEQILKSFSENRPTTFFYARILELNASCSEGTFFELPAFTRLADAETILADLKKAKDVIQL